MNLSIRGCNGDGVTTLEVAGEVAMESVDPLREAITAALDADQLRMLVVDLDSVSFLDSTGITVLVEGRRLADQRGAAYQVINPHGIVDRVLQATQVLDYLNTQSFTDQPQTP